MTSDRLQILEVTADRLSQLPCCGIKNLNHREIVETAEREFGLNARQVVLKSSHEAQRAPTPYAVFSVIFNGALLSDHQISKTRFRNLMKKQAGTPKSGIDTRMAPE